ncbi:glycoside hydrolase superfamily [Coprinopsis sp. MPI-PUGE-AT-0042]|nr:glycoside hydrolase superfamily [Coprinopsis sp. MPI-PUGE-AT-0042]
MNGILHRPPNQEVDGPITTFGSHKIPPPTSGFALAEDENTAALWLGSIGRYVTCVPAYDTMDEEQAVSLFGAAQPRFMGQYDGGGLRGSFAESSRSSARGTSEYGSVYALNDTRGAGYRDDPNGEHVPMSPVGDSRFLQEKENAYAAPRQKSRKKVFIIGAIIAAILVILAVLIPLYFTVIHDPKTTSKPGSDDSKSRAVVTGGDGSMITMEDGTTFEYKNSFGGYWYYDPNDPFNNGARAQSWNPALNETFDYGINKIRGVNVGGWLVTEPKYINVPAIDEWDLSIAMRADTSSGGGIDQLEEHYKTFITERDFAEIAAAGLNYVRIPIGFWAVETRGDEPYLSGVSWTYFLKAIKWCRKYGLRINLDLHAVPGSQNGWNHSGRFGTIGFLHGPMGYANAQRALDVIRVLAEFISQPQYKDVVMMFGIMNEPLGEPMTLDALTRFYMEAYHIVRRAGGTGEGNGPWISLQDGFFTRDQWANVFPNGGFLLGTRYEGEYAGYPNRIGDCDQWTNWPAYTPQLKAEIRHGRVETPAWSYQLGLKEGWMPTDPRDAAGVCGSTDPWEPPLQPYLEGRF